MEGGGALDGPSVRRVRAALEAAGHPHCVFATSLDELASLTGGVVSDRIGKG